jgi:hypothetical protein
MEVVICEYPVIWRMVSSPAMDLLQVPDAPRFQAAQATRCAQIHDSQIDQRTLDPGNCSVDDEMTKQSKFVIHFTCHINFFLLPYKIWSGRKHYILWGGLGLSWHHVSRVKLRISDRVIWKFNVGVRAWDTDRFGPQWASHVWVYTGIGGLKSHDTPSLSPPILVRFWIAMVYSK